MYALNNNYQTELGFSAISQIARLARRVANSIKRIFAINLDIPRHLGTLLLLLLFSLVGSYAIVTGGYTQQVLQVTASNLGLAIERISVAGNLRVTDNDVIKKLGLNVKTSMIGFDSDQARAELENLPWVRSANVQKIYPNQLNITITERQPYAVWQHGNFLDIVDNSGRVIVPFSDRSGDGLPLVVGQGAEKNAPQFIAEMSALPKIRDNIRAYVRIGDRRWDLVMNNGLRIKLPVEHAFDRLQQTVLSPQTATLFDRDVTEIDLRLDDRVTVALSPEALERRETTVKELSKKQKLREANRI